jgi:hypothetical protein
VVSKIELEKKWLRIESIMDRPLLNGQCVYLYSPRSHVVKLKIYMLKSLKGKFVRQKCPRKANYDISFSDNCPYYIRY